MPATTNSHLYLLPGALTFILCAFKYMLFIPIAEGCIGIVDKIHNYVYSSEDTKNISF